MRRWGAIVLAALALAPTAAAEEASRPVSGEELVTLRSGASYRGALVEKVPGDHVVIRLATGEIKRIEWSEMQSSVAVEAPAAPPPARPAAPEPPRGVRIVLEADGAHIALYRRAAEASNPFLPNPHIWAYECSDPCDVRVDPNAWYRVGGSDAMPSTEFRLPAGADPVTIKANVANVRAYWAGAVLFALGLIAVGTGATLLVLPKGNTDLTTPALVTGGAGVMTTVVGFVLMMVNARSSVAVNGKEPTPN